MMNILTKYFIITTIMFLPASVFGQAHYMHNRTLHVTADSTDTLHATSDSTDTLHATSDTAVSDNEFSPHVLIIFYQDASAKRRLRKALKKYHCETIYDYRNFNGMAVKTPDDANIITIAQRLRKIRGVLSVQRDRIMHLD